MAQAVHAEACGYRGVAIPEHHLVNILLIPSPLQMAAAIADLIKHPEKAAELGRQARLSALRDWDWQAIGKRQADAYRTLKHQY